MVPSFHRDNLFYQPRGEHVFTVEGMYGAHKYPSASIYMCFIPKACISKQEYVTNSSEMFESK